MSDAELEAVLGERPRSRRPWPYASSLPMEQLELAGDPPRQVLFKDLTASAKLQRPGFLADPLREITAYRRVLPGVAPDVPAHVASVAGPDRAWLFVELLDGRPLWQEGDLAVWQKAARWLTGLHAADPPPAADGLLHHDAVNLRRRVLLASWLPGVERIAGAVAERLAALPPRLIHGEFTAANVLVQRGGEGIRIRPVDWELAGTGPAALDLAALTSGGWSDGERAHIERAYLEACPSRLRPSDADLDHARLLLAAQWSGWCEGWQPPPQHRHDWCGEAERLVERLGL